MRQASHAGFTLIELLVVIAIIAILAAILFPVFAKVRQKAEATQCLSNEKQLMLSILMYVSDNNNVWFQPSVVQNPQYGPTPPPPAVPGNWNTQYNTDGTTTYPNGPAYAIWPYVMNSQIYICPLNSIALTSCPPYAPTMGYGVDMDSPMGAYGSTPPCSMSAWQYPAEFNVLCDRGGQNFYNDNTASSLSQVNGCNYQSFPHNNGANVAFLDGHAKWMAQADPLWGNCYYINNSGMSSQPNFNAMSHFWYGIDNF
jgi:prepilin-type N-terminal cleavage/methylation domain-containing protein/prepilin-type processing-associated H-X9-DG protein